MSRQTFLWPLVPILSAFYFTGQGCGGATEVPLRTPPPPPPPLVVEFQFGDDLTLQDAVTSVRDAVVPITFSNGHPMCTGTYLSPDLVLTAWHCMYKTELIRLGVSMEAFDLGSAQKKCVLNCDAHLMDVTPDRDLGTFLATASNFNTFPAVGHIEGSAFPQMVLYGYSGTSNLRLRTICGIRTVEKDFEADDYADMVKRGDSGGPLVAFVNGTPFVLAIVSGGFDEGGTRRYMAPIPSEEDFPLAQGATAPRFATFRSITEFSPVHGCNN